VLWVGSIGGMEQALVERAGIPYTGVETGQLRGKNPLTALANLWKMVAGFRRSLALLDQYRPQVCLVTGGYVCVPVVLACRRRGIPVMIYLPDMVPGAAIGWLSKLAQRVAVSFPAVAPTFGGLAPQGKAVVTGYPVRADLLAAADDRPAARRRLMFDLGLVDDPTLPLVLVWGGSQGSRSINQATWGALPALLPHAMVLHVVGERDWNMVPPALERLTAQPGMTPALRTRYHAVDYLHEAMPWALAGADITVARAGASILGEFPVAALPSVLVPLPFAGVGQQRNAEQLAGAGAAVLVDDARLDRDLAPAVAGLLADPSRLQAMGQAATRLATPDAARRIATALLELGAAA
jgi:UDP-N-acetylglucosamine:LPS N-acetylglucosamine transferase